MKMFLLYGHGFPPENDCCIQVYAQICFLSIKSREIVGFAKDIVYNTSNVGRVSFLVSLWYNAVLARNITFLGMGYMRRSYVP